MIAALESRGYGHGSVILSPDHTRFIANIPKNASSFICDWGDHQGWKPAIHSNHPEISEVIVILRDPVERWVSGISQYIHRYILSPYGPNGPIFPGEPITEHDRSIDAGEFIGHYNLLCERLFFDVASRFDDHVWPQSEILQGFPNCRYTWFWMDDSLEQKITHYLGWKTVAGLDRNRGDADPNKKKLQEFFQRRLDQRPELQDRLKRHYVRDYDLISKVIV